MEGAGPHPALSAFSAAIREIICEGCGATWVADGEDKDWHTSETEPYCLVCSRFLLPPSPPALSGGASSCQPNGGLAAGMAPGQATSSTGHPRSDVAFCLGGGVPIQNCGGPGAISASSVAIREIICEGCDHTWVADGGDKDWHTSETEPYCLVCSRFLLPPSPPALSGSASSCQANGGLAAGMAPGQATSSTGHPRSDVAFCLGNGVPIQNCGGPGACEAACAAEPGGHGDVVLPGCRTRAGE